MSLDEILQWKIKGNHNYRDSLYLEAALDYQNALVLCLNPSTPNQSADNSSVEEFTNRFLTIDSSVSICDLKDRNDDILTVILFNITTTAWKLFERGTAKAAEQRHNVELDTSLRKWFAIVIHKLWDVLKTDQSTVNGLLASLYEELVSRLESLDKSTGQDSWFVVCLLACFCTLMRHGKETNQVHPKAIYRLTEMSVRVKAGDRMLLVIDSLLSQTSETTTPSSDAVSVVETLKECRRMCVANILCSQPSEPSAAVAAVSETMVDPKVLSVFRALQVRYKKVPVALPPKTEASDHATVPLRYASPAREQEPPVTVEQPISSKGKGKTTVKTATKKKSAVVIPGLESLGDLRTKTKVNAELDLDTLI